MQKSIMVNGKPLTCEGTKYAIIYSLKDGTNIEIKLNEKIINGLGKDDDHRLKETIKYTKQLLMDADEINGFIQIESTFINVREIKTITVLFNNSQ